MCSTPLVPLNIKCFRILMLWLVCFALAYLVFLNFLSPQFVFLGFETIHSHLWAQCWRSLSLFAQTQVVRQTPVSPGVFGQISSVLSRFGWSYFFRGYLFDWLQYSPDHFKRSEALELAVYGPALALGREIFSASLMLVILYPLEAVITCWRTDYDAKYTGIMDCARVLFEQGGFTRLYNGVTVGLVSLLLCKTSKALLRTRFTSHRPYVRLILSDFISSSLAYPIETVRVLMMVTGWSAAQVLNHVLSKQGPTGLFNGFPPFLINKFLTCLSTDLYGDAFQLVIIVPSIIVFLFLGFILGLLVSFIGMVLLSWLLGGGEQKKLSK
eukprot:m.31906 g.31906  ORF g.31906 m.31906 type:complete len:326 (+) comp14862_c0_seq1:178-1155(+)